MADRRNAIAAKIDPTSPEKLLLDQVHRAERSKSRRFAVHIRLSKLARHNQMPHHIRIAERSFDSLLHSTDSQLYVMSNNDMLLMCRHVRVADIDATLYKVRTLFKSDPLVINDDENSDNGFCIWYDLEGDFEFFEEEIQLAALRSLDEVKRSRGKISQDEPLSPGNLEQIRQAIKRVDVFPFLRNRPVVLVSNIGAGDLLFREYFLAIGDLQKAIAPKINLLADQWLFQFLTETLDVQVLKQFSAGQLGGFGKRVSLNLNVATVNSRDFSAFDKAVGDQTENVTVELQKLDIFADMAGFFKARESLQKRGYKVLVDGLNPLMLQYFDPGLLKADYYKVNWGVEFEGNLSPRRIATMNSLVASMGADKVILARVDSENAVRFGLQLGVNRFQGYFVDKLLTAMAQKAGRAAANKA